MKFYHYTQSRRLESILEQGLRPVDEEERNYFFGEYWDADTPDGVVWLTTEPTNPHGDVVADVRITLELPRSRRLRRWEPWLQKHLPHAVTSPDYGKHPSWRSVWFFTGTISPDTFIDIEFDPLG
jgi:hypothetical protein